MTEAQMIQQKEIGGLCVRLRRLLDAERRGLSRPEDAAKIKHIIDRLNDIPGGDLLVELIRLKNVSGIVVV
jgi:hypothetical protein